MRSITAPPSTMNGAALLTEVQQRARQLRLFFLCLSDSLR